MRVAFVAAEVAPFAKAGGLADVIGALPKALANLGVEVAVFAPRYRSVPQGLPERVRLSVRLGRASYAVRILQGFLPRSHVPVYFLDQPALFDRPGIYGEGDQDYPDNLRRFSLLGKAAVEAAYVLPWEPEIFHVHDWHTALLPLFLDRAKIPARIVLTVHNLAFQGWFPLGEWQELGLPEEKLLLLGEGAWRCALRAGILAADALTTVSPSYAQEILADGLGLDDVLRAKASVLFGILNGIDVEEWDPQHDPHLWAPYSAQDLQGKAQNREALLRELGLSGEGPVVAMVGRLTEQKGLDLVLAGLSRMLSLGITLVILGTGEARYAQALKAEEERWPARLRVLLEYSELWAHRVMAGADFLLMPSRFEPCGLTQLYALRYGTIPIVRATGGLRDTVRDVKEGGNGLVFGDYSAEAMLETLSRAVQLWRDEPQTLVELRQRAMNEDHSWARSAQEYLRVYQYVLSR